MSDTAKPPVIVYCDRGGLSPAVKKMQRRLLITVIQGPYEERTGGTGQAIPSEVTCDSTRITWDSSILISQMCHSPLHEQIVRIINPNKSRDIHWDALHLDSAYKSKADAFTTSDKHDIVANRKALEALLSLRIFHVPCEDDLFTDWVTGLGD